MKTYIQHNNIVEFYKDKEHVGTIDYKDKSSSYIESAIHNYLEGVLTIEVIKKYSVNNL